jgi:hypothetical protein
MPLDLPGHASDNTGLASRRVIQLTVSLDDPDGFIAAVQGESLTGGTSLK